MSERNPNYGHYIGEGPWRVPDYAVALLYAALQRIEDVDAEPWDSSCAGEYVVPGLTLRPFSWGDDPDVEALPNLEFGDLRLWFYKYFGRGMSCNVDWTPAEWVDCYRALVKAIEGDEA